MSEAFLSRWSKRKRKARTAPPADKPLPAPEPPGAADGSVQAAAGPTTAELPAQPTAELPAIDSLGSESDYSGFLNPAVASDLRQEALRRLWASDPTLMAPETLDLHMGDYSTPSGTALVKTAWRLGKGVLDAAALAAEDEDARITPPDSPKV